MTENQEVQHGKQPPVNAEVQHGTQPATPAEATVQVDLGRDPGIVADYQGGDPVPAGDDAEPEQEADPGDAPEAAPAEKDE